MTYKTLCAVALAFAYAAAATSVEANGRRSLKDPPPRPAPAPVIEAPFVPQSFPYAWTGLYAGVFAGYGLGHIDHFYERLNGNNDHGQVYLDASGFLAGGYVGYNYQLPNLVVVGVEADLGFLGIDNERIVIKDDDVLSVKTGLFGTVRGRLGYALGRFMPYVTAGLAVVDIENSGANPANANRFTRIDETRIGFTVGAGAEIALTDKWVGRIEYLYLDTPRYEVRNLENEKLWFDNDFHLVRAGLSYRF